MRGATEAVEGLRRIWQRAKIKRQAAAELAAVSPSELHRMAADVGLCSSDLIQLTCSDPAHLELLPQRLEQLGLNVEFVSHSEPATCRDLARVCASCRAWRQCAADLAHGDAQAGMSGYCLNACAIDRLIVAEH